LGVSTHHGQGGTEIKAWLVGLHPQPQNGAAQELQGVLERGGGETGHIAASIQIRAIGKAGLSPEVPPPSWHGPPGIVHQHHVPAQISFPHQQPAFLAADRRPAIAA
jgi:hypothetical protein